LTKADSETLRQFRVIDTGVLTRQNGLSKFDDVKSTISEIAGVMPFRERLTAEIKGKATRRESFIGLDGSRSQEF
jgi:hypothetical protein